MNKKPGPIGVFDSGYGGLTVFKEINKALPEYDYIYLGDNARVPYGNRSFETVYQYTLECVNKLFEMGCSLIVLACNTASAKALRTIQQKDLPAKNELLRVLGVIRPTRRDPWKLQFQFVCYSFWIICVTVRSYPSGVFTYVILFIKTKN